MEIQRFSQINREDIGRPRGKFPSASQSILEKNLPRYRNSLIHLAPPWLRYTAERKEIKGGRGRQRKERERGGKKEIFLIIQARSPRISPASIPIASSPPGRGTVGGWIPSLSSRTPHFTNGKASLPPAKSLDWTCIFPFDTPQRSPDFIKNPRNLVPSLPSSATPRVEIFLPDAFIARPTLPFASDIFRKFGWSSNEFFFFPPGLDHFVEDEKISKRL